MARVTKLIILGLTSAILSDPSVALSHWAYTNTMTKAEILSKVIGNTVTGATSSGSTYAEYYTPDGVIHGLDSKKGKYTAKWSIRDDDLMCWASATDSAIEGCVLLVIKGDTITYQLIDGSTEGPVKLVSGNPKGLQ
jgi:hypothetical protein